MTDTTTKSPKARPATFTPEALQALIAEATAVALAKQRDEFLAAMKEQQQQAAKAEAKPAATGQSDQSHKNELAAIKAFKKAGFGIVKPHEDVRTFNKWVEAGLRPMEKSKSIKVQNLRLFHRSQCRKLTADEIKRLLVHRLRPRRAAR